MDIAKIKDKLQEALGENVNSVSYWLKSIEDPYKAVMMYAKVGDIFLKLNELELTGKADDGFNINITVQDAETQEALNKLINNEVNND